MIYDVPVQLKPQVLFQFSKKLYILSFTFPCFVKISINIHIERDIKWCHSHDLNQKLTESEKQESIDQWS